MDDFFNFKMFKFLVICLVLILIIIISTFVLINFKDNSPIENFMPDRKIIPLKLRGSIPYWDQDQAYASFKENIESFDYVALFWYYLDENGEILKYRDAKEDKTIIDFAHTNNVQVYAVITNLPEEEGSDWDSARVEKVISDPTLRKEHIAKIASKLDEMNFDGVSIDYEEVDKNQKDNFSLFVSELAESLHQKGKFVGVALHPKNKDTKEDEDLGAFQDWKDLADSADQLYIMAYGEHWDESQAGPIASYDWVEKILEYAKDLELAKDKIFLGIPLYAYRWQNEDDNPATGLTYSQVKKIINESDLKEKWDTSSHSPYIEYEKDGNSYQIWYENAKSVNDKIELAKRFKIAGVTFWRLGGEDPKIWEEIRFNN